MILKLSLLLCSVLSAPTDLSVQQEEVPQAVVLEGRAADQWGRPIVGARVHVVNRFLPGERKPAVTDEGGAFRISLLTSEFEQDQQVEPWCRTSIAIVADGYGVETRHASRCDRSGRISKTRVPAGGPTITLREATVGIRGRLTDVTGEGVAGVTVRVVGFMEPEGGDLFPMIESMRKGEDWDVIRSFEGRWRGIFYRTPPEHTEDILPNVQTDKDGVFQIKGMGDGRIVHLLIKKPGFVTEIIRCRTMPGRDYIIPHLLEHESAGSLHYYGSFVAHTLDRAPSIVGAVHDSVTGTPIAGVRIKPWTVLKPFQPLNMEFASDIVWTHTDAEGRFRLEGAPPGTGVRVDPAGLKTPYLESAFGATKLADDANLPLARGVLVEGRVIVKGQGGKPVPADVRYFPARQNKAAEKLRKQRVQVEGLARTDVKGAFMFTAPPGPGTLIVQALYAHDFHRDGVNCHASVDLMINADGVEGGSIEIQLRPVERSLACEILDSNGRPLSGVEFFDSVSTAPFIEEGAVIHLEAFSGENRRLNFFHRKLQLAGTYLLTGAQPDGLQIRLSSAASVTGRVVDKRGNPIANLLICGWFGGPSPGKFDTQHGQYFERHYLTDAEGYFLISGLAPGVSYRLVAARDLANLDFGKVGSGVISALKAGEERNLGELRVTDM